MTPRKTLGLLCGALIALGSLHAFQLPWREYPGVEYNDFEAPADYDEVTDWVFARMKYPPRPGAQFDYAGPRWAEGGSTWTQDYPRADRHFLTAVRRLTFINARSVEQAVNFNDGDDVFNYPFLYAVRTGEWELTPEIIKKFREYIDRGGFFMTDDFWGDYQWDNFMRYFQQVFPDRDVVDIPEDDQVFHNMYDLSERYQIYGSWGLGGGGQARGTVPYWRAVYDDHDRAVAVIYPNNDMGDSWEFADDPYYPERLSRMGIRLGINSIIYAFTH